MPATVSVLVWISEWARHVHLRLPSAFQNLARLDDSVEFEAAILADRRESVEVELSATERVDDGVCWLRWCVQAELFIAIDWAWLRGLLQRRRVRQNVCHDHTKLLKLVSADILYPQRWRRRTAVWVRRGRGWVASVECLCHGPQGPFVQLDYYDVCLGVFSIRSGQANRWVDCIGKRQCGSC